MTFNEIVLLSVTLVILAVNFFLNQKVGLLDNERKWLKKKLKQRERLIDSLMNEKETTNE
jgi:hypothetical protein